MGWGLGSIALIKEGRFQFAVKTISSNLAVAFDRAGGGGGGDILGGSG